ncbi:MAG: NAD(P)-dependent oxidoreductase [Pseudorhodobacter sp.]
MTDRTIGIIGVGLMGHGIAINIVKKGWRLNFLHHEGNQPTADLAALGAVAFDEPQALAEASDVVILCLNGSPQVEAVMLGNGGVLEALRPGSVVVDCSTAVPSSTELIAGQVAAAGSRFMDAAMTRTPLEAAEGRLNLLIGAEEGLYAEMEPLLSSFSENRMHAGDVGAGHTLKLLHNFVSLGSVLLISEAAACASASGIEPAVLIDALRKGGGHGAALDRVAPFLLEGDTSRMKFTVANAQKDLAYYGRLAAETGAEAQIAAGVLAALAGLVEAGMAGRFLSEASAAFAETAAKG